GFLDLLETDGLFGQPGDRKCPRYRAERHHQDVVRELVLVTLQRLDCHPLACMVDPHYPAGDDLASLEHAAQLDHYVTRLQVAGRRLWEEGLVRHHRPRIDQGHPCFALAQVLPEPKRCIHPDVPTTKDHDSRRAHGPTPSPHVLIRPW